MKYLGLSTLFVLIMTALVFTQDNANSNQGQEPGTPPSVSVNPGNIDFGEQVTKKPGKAQRITVTNTGGKKLYINSVVIAEDDQQDFTISHDTCTGKEIEAKKSCVIDVVFTATVNDRRKSKLVLTDNAIDSPQRLLLTGVGINSVAVPPSKSGSQ
jgi:hypothetical protein